MTRPTFEDRLRYLNNLDSLVAQVSFSFFITRREKFASLFKESRQYRFASKPTEKAGSRESVICYYTTQSYVSGVSNFFVDDNNIATRRGIRHFRRSLSSANSALFH